jgi:class 3 adenylate cyclase/tetratricopeptide (TPR) repeat protein
MPEERRLVSVLFADLVGFTALGSRTDPEVLREQMAQYFERMKAVAEVHGGTVEKFIGDAVMVAFGVPRRHDDDAERAVRCGLAMQESMAGLNRELGTDFSVRVGINSGEAAVTSRHDGHFIVGDPVNVAARLQQGAEAGEVLVGSLTEQLTRTAMDYEPRGRLAAKGKVDPILAFRAIRPKTAVPRQSRGVTGLRAPLVGRERELRLLLDTFRRVVEDGQAHLFTLVGNAGIGKSRLIEEVLARIAAEFGPRILQGHCLPYGKGITYWPVMEILREDTGITLEDDRETAAEKLEARLGSLGQSAEHQRALARRLAVVLGLEAADSALAEVPAAEVATELAWAIRRYIEAVARQEPVVIVIDDLQWAESAIVDLVGQVTHRARPGPVLWICMARPEFLEQQLQWGAGRTNVSLIAINPLTALETSTLISGLLEIEDIPNLLHQSLIERSEGNPLFCEEFLRMLIEESLLVRVTGHWQATAGVVEVRVPETIQALLAARLDTLPEPEKIVLEAASIIGERFLPGQVRALCVDLDVDGTLDELLSKGLIVEDPSSGEASGLRLKHLLLRDVAYGAIAKRSRADLHERFAAYLESLMSDRGAEYAEIIAHHATLAVGLSREMRLSSDVILPRGRRALHWNLFLADRALTRGDWVLLADCISSVQSTLAALPTDGFVADQVRLRLLEAEHFRASDRYDKARATAAEAAVEAAGIERWDLAAAAHLCSAQIELERDPSGPLFARQAEEAGRLFRLIGDPAGELEAEWLTVLHRMGGEGDEAFDDAIRLAERAVGLNDKSRAAVRFARTATFAAQAGLPRQAKNCVDRASTLAEEAGARLGGTLVLAQAMLDTVLGDPERAVDRLQRAVASGDEDGRSTIAMKRLLAVELIRLGRYAEADAILEDALKRSQHSGELWNRTELFARHAVSAVAQGKLDAAEGYAQQALQAATPGRTACCPRSRPRSGGRLSPGTRGNSARPLLGHGPGR